ncbi:MAG: alanyl-tRNA editing protein [Gammaproteobacteria bacterium]|nr:alanyl-tRNA editing protein [Gammaproteobacteria bacterium]
MTEELFRKDSYLKSCEATVTAAQDSSVVLDKTVFYPLGGGQPGDTGVMIYSDGSQVSIIDTKKSAQGIVHVLEEGASEPAVGEPVTVEINWGRRHRLMRMHSCMHLLCSIIPFGVTGGSIRDDSARLDFDAQQPMDKEAINVELNRLIKEDHAITMSWISEQELDAQPELVRTMSVQPPRGNGSIRLINFEGVDLQPCGGTHVNSTAEIGAVRIRKIEKKGKHNRRVNIVFDE